MDKAKFDTVVVGVDFSRYSKIVVKQAVHLAKSQGASLVVVHMVNTPDFIAGEMPYIDYSKELVEPLPGEIKKFYNLKVIAPKAKIVVNSGSSSQGIIAVAKEYQRPLIVAGHRGKSTIIGRYFLGSTAEQLALQSPFPVWIHRGLTTKTPKKILVPNDYSDGAELSLETAQALNGSAKSEFEFFRAVQQPIAVLDAGTYVRLLESIRSNEATQQKKWHEKFPNVPFVCKTGEAGRLITKESKKFDLIAMAPHNRDGLFSSFGSVTAKVIRQGDTPLLVVH